MRTQAKNLMVTINLIAGIAYPLVSAHADSVTWSQGSRLPTTLGTTCTLQVAIERLEMPHIADVDIMADQIKKRKRHHLIMKVEPLDSVGEFSKDTATLTENDIRTREAPFAFTYPCTSQTRVLAVSLCSDDTETGTCMGKKPALMNSLTPTSEPLSDTSDKVYFFGVFILRDGSLGALPVLDKGRYSVLKNALSAEVNVAPDEAQRIGADTARYNDAISSYPLILKDDKVIARLPRTAFNFQSRKPGQMPAPR